MDKKENTQEMTETQLSDLPQDSFQLTDHPWLAADVTVEDEIRYALDEIRLCKCACFIFFAVSLYGKRLNIGWMDN